MRDALSAHLYACKQLDWGPNGLHKVIQTPSHLPSTAISNTSKAPPPSEEQSSAATSSRSNKHRRNERSAKVGSTNSGMPSSGRLSVGMDTPAADQLQATARKGQSSDIRRPLAADDGNEHSRTSAQAAKGGADKMDECETTLALETPAHVPQRLQDAFSAVAVSATARVGRAIEKRESEFNEEHGESTPAGHVSNISYMCIFFGTGLPQHYLEQANMTRAGETLSEDSDVECEEENGDAMAALLQPPRPFSAVDAHGLDHGTAIPETRRSKSAGDFDKLSNGLSRRHEKSTCPFCNCSFRGNGLSSHLLRCKKQKKSRETRKNAGKMKAEREAAAAAALAAKGGLEKRTLSSGFTRATANNATKEEPASLFVETKPHPEMKKGPRSRKPSHKPRPSRPIGSSSFYDRGTCQHCERKFAIKGGALERHVEICRKRAARKRPIKI